MRVRDDEEGDTDQCQPTSGQGHAHPLRPRTPPCTFPQRHQRHTQQRHCRARAHMRHCLAAVRAPQVLLAEESQPRPRPVARGKSGTRRTRDAPPTCLTPVGSTARATRAAPHKPPLAQRRLFLPLLLLLLPLLLPPPLPPPGRSRAYCTDKKDTR